MTILTSVIVIAVIAAIALFIVRNVQQGKNTLTEIKKDFFNNKEAQELAELSKELYNKDLRPIVAKKAPKKQKPVEQVETIAEVVTPQVVEEVVDKVKESKPEFPIDKPKKKRRHYPKKK